MSTEAAELAPSLDGCVLMTIAIAYRPVPGFNPPEMLEPVLAALPQDLVLERTGAWLDVSPAAMPEHEDALRLWETHRVDA